MTGVPRSTATTRARSGRAEPSSSSSTGCRVPVGRRTAPGGRPLAASLPAPQRTNVGADDDDGRDVVTEPSVVDDGVATAVRASRTGSVAPPLASLGGLPAEAVAEPGEHGDVRLRPAARPTWRGCWGWRSLSASDQTASAGIHHGVPARSWALTRRRAARRGARRGAHGHDRALAQGDDRPVVDDDRRQRAGAGRSPGGAMSSTSACPTVERAEISVIRASQPAVTAP